MFCTFDDIVGYEEEKEELEIMAAALEKMAADPKASRFCPRGLLLAGAPGLGKTFFAETLINEVQLPTFSIDGTALSGSLGEACKKIKSVFKKAKKKKTAIIFIDEIGRITTNVSYNGFESDASRTVLSCLLTCMEGIDDSRGIFVVMTANDIDSLDPALIRPGRIDKIIEFYDPTIEDREKLFQHFVMLHPEFDGLQGRHNIDFKMLAKKTAGFSCAAIKSLVAEVGLMLSTGMVKGSRKIAEGVYDADVTKTFLDKIFYMLGVKRTSLSHMPKDALRRTIVHEIGHAIAKHAKDGKWSDIVINAANKGSVGGLTHFVVDEWEDPYATKKTVIEDVAVCLGGRAAEEMFIGDVSGGCSEDIRDAKVEINGACDAGIFGFEAVSNALYADQTSAEAVTTKRLSIFRSTLKKGYEKAKEDLSTPLALYIEEIAENIIFRKMMISSEELSQIEREFKEGTSRTLVMKEEPTVKTAAKEKEKKA